MARTPPPKAKPKRLGWRAARWVASPAFPEAVEAFRRACELTLSANGVHGIGRVSVERYQYANSDLMGDWVEYAIEIKKGEPFVETHDAEDGTKRIRRPRTMTTLTGRRIGIIGLQTAKDFMIEVAASIGEYHKQQPANWRAYGETVTEQGMLQELGYRNLSTTIGVDEATGQGMARLDDWLSGIVSSSSNIGAVEKLEFRARLS